MEKKPTEELVVINETETDDVREPRRYELGYLLVPIIAPTAVIETVETLIRGTIMKLGGKIIDGEEPKLIPTMYSIRKTIDNKSLRFKEAYFASLRFTLVPEKVIELDQTLRASTLVLRFLIVERPTQIEKPRRQPKEDNDIFATKTGETVGTMSQAEMDREIDSLLTATT